MVESCAMHVAHNTIGACHKSPLTVEVETCVIKHMDRNHPNTSRRFVLGKDVVCNVYVAVLYSNELQSVCEGMLG